MDAKTQHGYLVLADISGYTSFVAATELEHAHEILTELLELILSRFTPTLTLSKLEGDAVFAYVPEAKLRRGETLLELIEATYVAFRDRRERRERLAHVGEIIFDGLMVLPRDAITVDAITGLAFGGGHDIGEAAIDLPLDLLPFDEELADDRPLLGVDLGAFDFEAHVRLLFRSQSAATLPARAHSAHSLTHRTRRTAALGATLSGRAGVADRGLSVFQSSGRGFQLGHLLFELFQLGKLVPGYAQCLR